MQPSIISAPLAGVLAGLDWATNQGDTHIATVAVDIQFFPCSLVPHLLLAGKAQPRSFAIAATSDGLHGTLGIWPTVLHSDLATFLEQGHHNFCTFAQAQGQSLQHSPTPNHRRFFKINTPKDLKSQRNGYDKTGSYTAAIIKVKAYKQHRYVWQRSARNLAAS